MFPHNQVLVYAARLAPMAQHGGGAARRRSPPANGSPGARSAHGNRPYRAMGRSYLFAVAAAAAGGLLQPPLSLGEDRSPVPVRPAARVLLTAAVARPAGAA